MALNEHLRRLELEATQEQQMQMQQRQQRSPPQQHRQSRGPPQQQRGMPPPPAAGASRAPPRRPGEAKHGGWGGMTHTADQARAIDRENQLLVNRLTTIASGPRVAPQHAARGSAPPPGSYAPRASAAINRAKKNDQIAQENARLAKRLASAKPALANTKAHAAKQDTRRAQMSRTAPLEPRGRSSTPSALLGPPRVPRAAPGAQGHMTEAVMRQRGVPSRSYVPPSR